MKKLQPFTRGLFIRKNDHLKLLITFILFSCVEISVAQTNIFPSTGNAGIGTTTPVKPLEVLIPTGDSYKEIIGVKNVDYTFNSDRYYQAVPVPPTIGIDNNYGLTWYNDGYLVGTAIVANQKIVANAANTADIKMFRVNAPENNLGNYSLELSNYSSAFSNPTDIWHQKPNSANLKAWNRSLHIGSIGGSLRFYADAGTPNKVADIYVYDSRIGIGTETPNTNAKLDVNGNIFTNGKLVIGTTDAAQYGTHSLAVNGTAIMNKVKVKTYGTWPDYVFENEYQLPDLLFVEKYIKTHKHLPEVPASAEIEKEGLDLGDMQAVLLKKIEELTLYMIHLNKKVDLLTEENNQLKQSLNK
jgi:hypothetical protein